VDTLIRDFRQALRSLTRSQAVSLVAVSALGLGIGAAVTLFSLVNAVLLRPLPYRDPGRLVVLWGNVRRAEVERRGASYPDFLDWRRSSTSFAGMAAYWSSGFSLVEAGDSERVDGEVVSPDYLGLLGVAPELGRGFLPEEERGLDADPVVLISDGLWARRFGRDPAILERRLQLDDLRARVVGVLPARFRGLDDAADVWIPTGDLPSSETLKRGDRWFPVLARLRPGVSREKAQQEIDAVSRQLEEQFPATNEARGVEVAPLARELTGDLRLPLMALLGASGLLLVLTVANVAGLLLARSEGRQQEVAIRSALGAGRGRLLRQFVAEGLLLAGGGVALGWLLARWATDVLTLASPIELPSFVRPHPDLEAAVFAAGTAGLVGIVLGLAPALHLRGDAPADALKSSSAAVGGSRPPERLRSALVVGEIALAVVLLVGSGLLLGSLRQLAAVDPGFRAKGVLELELSLSRPASTAALRERLVAVPGVRSVGLGSDMPLGGQASAIFYAVEGRPAEPPETRPRAYVHRVGPGFFGTLGVPILRGRDLDGDDGDGVVVVSEGIVRRFWPNSDPIGRKVGSAGHWARIVGVVPDLKYRGLPRNPTADPDLYLPLPEQRQACSVLLSTEQPPEVLVRSVRAALVEIDPAATLYDVAPLSKRVARETARTRFTAWVASVFSGVALFLACIGLYGVISYLVARRRREFGVRMALGAAPGDLLRLVLGRGIALAGAGALLGLGGATFVTRLVTSLLYGVAPWDPATFGAVALGLVAAAGLAAWFPAARAGRIDPLTVLREE
jgi:putative ABC transport system permease protein